MRACMLGYTYYETDNRVMRYSETLAKQGYKVDVIALRKPGQCWLETIRGVHVYRIQKRISRERTGSLAYLVRLMRFLLRSFALLSVMHACHPYRVVHVHSVPGFEIFAALIPRLTGSKLILDIHDIFPNSMRAISGSDRSQWLFDSSFLLKERLVRLPTTLSFRIISGGNAF